MPHSIIFTILLLTHSAARGARGAHRTASIHSCQQIYDSPLFLLSGVLMVTVLLV